MIWKWKKKWIWLKKQWGLSRRSYDINLQYRSVFAMCRESSLYIYVPGPSRWQWLNCHVVNFRILNSSQTCWRLIPWIISKVRLDKFMTVDWNKNWWTDKYKLWLDVQWDILRWILISIEISWQRKPNHYSIILHQI